MASCAKYLGVALAMLLPLAVFGGTDHTLATVSPACKEMYQKMVAAHYKDVACQPTMEKILSAATTDPAVCPDTKAGSAVAKCIAISEAAIKDWVDFANKCEILNIGFRESTAGEGEAEMFERPSCFQSFDNVDAFKKYMTESLAAAPAAAPAAKNTTTPAATPASTGNSTTKNNAAGAKASILAVASAVAALALL